MSSFLPPAQGMRGLVWVGAGVRAREGACLCETRNGARARARARERECVCGWNSRVQGLGCRVQGLGFRV